GRARPDLELLVVVELGARARDERRRLLVLEREQAPGPALDALGRARLRLLDEERPPLPDREPDRVVVLEVADGLDGHAEPAPGRRRQRRAELEVGARARLVDDDPGPEAAHLIEELGGELRLLLARRHVEVVGRRDAA